MVKLKSSKPIFVDLFYAVVVGSTVPKLNPFLDLQRFFFQFIWIIAVLEDLYLYHRHVVDLDNKAVSYTFQSIFFELLILTSWLLGFLRLSDTVHQNWFFFFLAIFYGTKILAGVTFNLKHKLKYKAFSLRKMLYDLLWLLQIIIALLAFLGVIDCTFSSQFVLVAVVTLISIVMWWVMTTKFP